MLQRPRWEFDEFACLISLKSTSGLMRCKLGSSLRVVVGNSHTLKADEHWEKWLQFYEKVASGLFHKPLLETRNLKPWLLWLQLLFVSRPCALA